jgi:hypothetical protein
MDREVKIQSRYTHSAEGKATLWEDKRGGDTEGDDGVYSTTTVLVFVIITVVLCTSGLSLPLLLLYALRVCGGG